MSLILPVAVEALAAHSELLARSLRHWTGRELAVSRSDAPTPSLPPAPGTPEFAIALFHAPFVLVSHGTEADPVLNYGNRAALDLWEMSWEQLTRTPSRFTAEAPDREERARLLERVTRYGFIDDYSGIRISRTGRRFRIHRATVWNLIDAAGRPAGQAATFDRWEHL